jgi:DNA repair exonuclease SbcCD ATPase subunit
MSKREKDKGAESELVAAAEALDAELKTFERLADAARRHPLSSQKNLERMVGVLKEAAESDARMEGAVRALAEAITAARQKQQAQAEVVHARALALQQRTEAFMELQRSFQALGASAADLTVRMKEVIGQRGGGAPGEGSEGGGGGGGGGLAGLADLVERTGAVTDEARRLAEAAKEKDFGDIAQQADGLRQQLAAARNRLGMLQKRGGGGG